MLHILNILQYIEWLESFPSIILNVTQFITRRVLHCTESKMWLEH